MIFCVTVVFPSSWILYMHDIGNKLPKIESSNRFLDCLYIKRVSSSPWTPLTMSSSYICRLY